MPSVPPAQHADTSALSAQLAQMRLDAERDKQASAAREQALQSQLALLTKLLNDALHQQRPADDSRSLRDLDSASPSRASSICGECQSTEPRAEFQMPTFSSLPPSGAARPAASPFGAARCGSGGSSFSSPSRSSPPCSCRSSPASHPTGVQGSVPPSAPPSRAPASPAPYASALAFPDFSKSRVNQLCSGLAPDESSLFITEFVEAVIDVAGDSVADLILLDDEADFKSRTSGDTAEAVAARAADRWAASQLLQCLDKKCPYVTVLRNTVAERPELRRSAWQLLWYIAHPELLHSTCSLDNLADAFKERMFFKPTDTLQQTLAAGTALKKAFDALPEVSEVRVRKHGLIRAALVRIPVACAEQRKFLEDRLIETDAIGAPPPWSYDQLVHIIGNHILAAAKRGKSANALEEVPKKPPGPPSSLKCHACGKSGHSSPDCTGKCASCGLKACPGHYGGAKACVVAMSVFPKKSDVKNAVGREVTRWTYDRLLQKHASRHKETNDVDAEASTAPEKSSSAAELPAGKRSRFAECAAEWSSREDSTAFSAYLAQVDMRSSSCAEREDQGKVQPLRTRRVPAAAH